MAMVNLKIEMINITLVIRQKKIKYIHSYKKFGGTRTNPSMTVIGLFGQGAIAFLIAIDSDKAITSKEVTVSLDARIWNCKDATKLKELEDNDTNPPVAVGTRTKHQTGAASKDRAPPAPNATATAVSAQGNQKYMAPPAFIPLPFLGDVAFECILDNPLNIIKAIKNAATNFNRARKDSNPKFKDAMKGAKLIARWLYTVHKNLVDKTRITIEPDNVELLAYAEDQHSKCILPSLKQIS